MARSERNGARGYVTMPRYAPGRMAVVVAHDAWERRPADERAWVAIDNALVDVGVGALSRWQRRRLALRRWRG